MIEPSDTFAPHSLIKLETLMGRVPATLSRLYELGFTLPSEEVAFIDSLRTREPSERPFVHYVAEVAREFLYTSSWGQEKRKKLPDGIRSVYLDYLDGQSENLGDGNRSQAILDPNYRIYARLAYDDLDHWMQHLEFIRSIREAEAVTFAMKHDVPTQLDVRAFSKFFLRAANEFGFVEIKEKTGKHSRRLVRKDVLGGLQFYLEWEELDRLGKWGELSLNWYVQEIGKDIPTQKKDWQCWLRIPYLAPGLEWYARENTSPASAAHCFIAYLTLLELYSA